MKTKYTRQLIAGDVIKLIDGSIAEVTKVEVVESDKRLFVVWVYNRNTKQNDCDYQHGGVECELVGA